MKRFALLTIAVLVLSLGSSTLAHANSLVINGDFESPNVGNSWSAFAGIPGWSTNGNAIEIDNPLVFGGGSVAYSGTQSLELNYDYPESVYQTVNGLTVGQTYTLTFAYGDRPDSGDEEMQVTFGGNVVATDYDLLDGANSTTLWTPNSVTVTATGTSEVLSFNGLYYTGPGGSVYDNGGLSYGNEVDAVSLVPTPEPSTWMLLLSGVGLIGFTMLRKQQNAVSLGSF